MKGLNGERHLIWHTCKLWGFNLAICVCLICDRNTCNQWLASFFELHDTVILSIIFPKRSKKKKIFRLEMFLCKKKWKKFKSHYIIEKWLKKKNNKPTSFHHLNFNCFLLPWRTSWVVKTKCKLDKNKRNTSQTVKNISSQTLDNLNFLDEITWFYLKQSY